MLNEMLWVERYRPKKVADCILPAELKATFQQFVDNKQLPNLLLSGGAGQGKTTVAIALCEELGYDWMLINGSEEGRLIETLRTKIKGYASSVSLHADRKVVIVDEADFVPRDNQAAFRSIIEEFSNNCGFIFTCNFKTRMMDAIHSRCSNIDFVIPAAEKSAMASAFMKRCCFILEDNKVEFDKKAIAAVIMKFLPDWRRTINELQRYSAGGRMVDSGILSLTESNSKTIAKWLKEKNFAEIKKWVFTSPTIDIATLCRELDTDLYDMLQPKSIPASILVYADYQHKYTTALDPKITILAMFVDLMMNLEFK